MLTRRHFIYSVAPLALTGCLAVTKNNEVVVGRNLTRETPDGTVEVRTKDGWKSTAITETKIDRQTVWYVSMQDSGIKAWRFGFPSNQNHLYLDPLSPIVGVSGFSATGWATYLVKGNDYNDHVVKRVNFVQGGEPEILGRLEHFRGEWRFTPVGRPTIAAIGYQLTSKGMMLTRTPTAFTYFPSANPAVRMLPEDWNFAWSQRGDIEASRFLIVKKRTGGLFDYGHYLIGFYDFDKQALLPTVLDMKFIADVAAEQFSNRFFLYDTPRGPVTVTLEDGVNQVVVRNIKTGEKRVAFERAAGIATITAEQTNTGRIFVTAAVGFSDKEIYDAEDFLYNGRMTPPSS